MPVEAKVLYIWNVIHQQNNISRKVIIFLLKMYSSLLEFKKCYTLVLTPLRHVNTCIPCISTILFTYNSACWYTTFPFLNNKWGNIIIKCSDENEKNVEALNVVYMHLFILQDFMIRAKQNSCFLLNWLIIFYPNAEIYSVECK